MKEVKHLHENKLMKLKTMSKMQLINANEQN